MAEQSTLAALDKELLAEVINLLYAESTAVLRAWLLQTSAGGRGQQLPIDSALAAGRLSSLSGRLTVPRLQVERMPAIAALMRELTKTLKNYAPSGTPPRRSGP